MIIILRLAPTFQLFNRFNATEYDNIKCGFYNIAKELFGSEFLTYVLPGDNDSLYIVFNIESPDDSSRCNEILSEMNGLLINDFELVNLSVGKSNPHRGIEGLRLAHKEASDSMETFADRTNHVLIGTKPAKEYDFDTSDESDLFAALLSMNKKKIYTFIDTVFERNKTKPNHVQKQLYTSVINITLNAFNVKRMPLPDGKTEKSVISEIADLTLHDTRKLVSYYIECLLKNSKEDTDGSGENLGRSIVEYVEENFTFQGMSVEYLADYFHISPAGVSLNIKNALGIGFHEFLSNLRITKAKTLLLTTDDSVADICTKCGFSSQQTFYRSFKKITGMTTSEMRSQKKE